MVSCRGGHIKLIQRSLASHSFKDGISWKPWKSAPQRGLFVHQSRDHRHLEFLSKWRPLVSGCFLAVLPVFLSCVANADDHQACFNIKTLSQVTVLSHPHGTDAPSDFCNFRPGHQLRGCLWGSSHYVCKSVK